MPEHVVPMLAKLSKEIPQEAGYSFEVKWDGIRCITYLDRGHMRLESRNLIDITGRYPELNGLLRACPKRRIVLDGEVIATDETGRPSFSRLQERMQLTSTRDVARKMEEVPILYAIFDILYYEGQNTMHMQYSERRALLASLDLQGEHWQTPAYIVGNGEKLLRAARERNLEGIMAKRLNSTYEAGKRTGAWLKIKQQSRQELVIGGWMRGEGRREGTIGSLLIGYYDRSRADAMQARQPQQLVYAGKAGTGFTDAELDRLTKVLAPLRRGTCPFELNKPRMTAVWVEPRLVAEFEFAEWTHLGSARHPSYKGLRIDKDPRDVVREDVPSAGKEK